MTRQFLQTMRRLRKAQDAIFNDKIKSDISLGVETHNSNLCGQSYIYVMGATRETLHGDVDTFSVFIYNHDTADKIEDSLTKIAQFLGITI